ncbi:CTAG/PCC1 family protein [Candidatus Bathyarchaeota archaeon]|nr:CTAG/PCC1 family protein [Candidatus Bathyarchaeota archaeon]
MAKQHEAQLIISGSDRRMEASYKAMRPETLRKTQGICTVLSMRDGALLISFEADTIPSLRALVNSYLRWLFMIEKTLDIVENKSDN